MVQGQFLLAFWETLYVTIAAMFFAVVIGLPLGVILVVGEKSGLAPLPGWLMKTINVIINLLRSVPFLILMILLFPFTRRKDIRRIEIHHISYSQFQIR